MKRESEMVRGGGRERKKEREGEEERGAYHLLVIDHIDVGPFPQPRSSWSGPQSRVSLDHSDGVSKIEKEIVEERERETIERGRQ